MNKIVAISLMVATVFISGCSGGSSGADTSDSVGVDTSDSVDVGTSDRVSDMISAPNLSLSFQSAKAFQFSWGAVSGVNHYNLLEDPDSSSGFTQVAVISAGTEVYELQVPLYARVNSRYILEACSSIDDSVCESSNMIAINDTLVSSIGYIKASNTDQNDSFGASVSLSGDGNTLAVGAIEEASSTTGINSTPDNLASSAGAVYVFSRVGSTWSQQAYIKASNTDQDDRFGSSVSLSEDGNTLAVGAIGEASATIGIDSTPNNLAPDAGAVYVFSRVGSTWSQQAYLKAANTDQDDFFGISVSLSSDGNLLAVGALREGSATIGIDSTPNNLAPGAGAVYVFSRADTTWVQQAYVKASNTDQDDHFGHSVSLSADASTLAVGATREDGSTVGINSIPDNLALGAGAVYVFSRADATWVQQAYVKASNTDSGDIFGFSVSLSAEGNSLAVGAVGEDSTTTGINSEPDNGVSFSGAVYVFSRTDTTWAQQAYVKAGNTDSGDVFGFSVSLNADGNSLVVGALREASATTGIDTSPDNLASGAGAVYVFSRTDTTWSQQAFVKASNTDSNDLFGSSVNLSADGNTLAVGAEGEASATTGFDSTPNNLAPASGAVYLF